MRITITAKRPIDPSYDSNDELELVFDIVDHETWRPISIKNAHIDGHEIPWLVAAPQNTEQGGSEPEVEIA